MFCNNCGKELPDGANVCGYCGRPVDAGSGTGGNGGSRSGSYGGTGASQNVYGESAPSYSGQSTGANSQYSYTGYQAQNPGYGYGAPVSPMDGGAVGLAITSLVLGVVALLIVCCVSIWWLTVIVAFLGIVFGAVSLAKHMGGRGMALAGMICSIAALVIEIFLLLLGVGVLAAFFSAMIH